MLLVVANVEPAAGFTMVTWKLYVPGAVNVATVFFAAFVPLTLKFTGAGPLVMDQVYVRADSPAVTSEARALSVVLVVVMGLADDAAAFTILGFAKLSTSAADSPRPKIRKSSMLPRKPGSGYCDLPR